MADLLNWILDREKALKKLKGTTIEACRWAKMVENVSEHLKEALSKMEADLAKVKAD